MSTTMRSSKAKPAGCLQGEAAVVPQSSRHTGSACEDYKALGHPGLLSNLLGALLFADVADARGGRIAVFYRCGSAALELGDPFTGQTSVHAAANGSGQG